MNLKFILILFTSYLILSSGTVTGSMTLDQNDLLSDSNLQFIQSNINITVSKSDKYDEGINIFGLYQGENNLPFSANNSYLTTMDMNGNIDSKIASPGRYFGSMDKINETTFMTMYEHNPMLWNYKTNVTQTFDFTNHMHHDMAYNPETQTFMVIEAYLENVLNETGQPELMIVDRLREYNMNGDIQWQWNATNHLDPNVFFEYYDLVNQTSRAPFRGPGTPPGTFRSIMHTNSIDWDYQHHKIYINVRRMNQFVKIDYPTGDVDWIAGRGGNFSLIPRQGRNATSLWYTPHDVSYLGNNEFLMFDNGANNITAYQSGIPNSERSSILRVKVNESDMTITPVFRWTAPLEYFSFHWGGAQLLPNGNYLGSFGSWYHATNRTANPFTTQFGGVAVEVTPQGEIVWEMKLPYLWGFFRFNRFFPASDSSNSSLSATGDQLPINFLLPIAVSTMAVMVIFSKRKLSHNC